MNVVYFLLLTYMFTYKIKNKNKHKKEILTLNNLDQIYQTHVQEEILASSNINCVFRCTSELSDNSILKKLKEVTNRLNEKQYDLIKRVDQQYYCSSVKPLYLVKL